MAFFDLTEVYGLDVKQYLKIARDGVSRILSVKSARGVSFALAVMSSASKPLGYARTLIIAWTFGTSPGIDAYHLAAGIISLFAGSVGQALESAVLPELIRIKKETDSWETCRCMAAFISSLVLLGTVIFAAALAAAPGVIVRFFARGFDSERIAMGAVTLWWLIPFAAVTMFKPMLDIWANFTERYTLPAAISTIFNFIAIPLMLVSIRFIGVYSAAFSMSAAHGAVFFLTLAAMGGVPVFWRRRDMLWNSVISIARGSLYTTAIAASSAMYVIVDRYFASMLPSGSVAAISYAALLIGVMASVVSMPAVFFLSRMSGLALDDAEEAVSAMKKTAALSMAYLIPVSAFTAVLSKPVIAMVFGWGSFDSRSVEMTATCLSSYSIGFSFSVGAAFMYRYAQARRRLGTIVILSYVLVMVNAVLDWALTAKWGLLGLTLATSFTQILGFAAYYLAVVGGDFPKYIMRMKFFEQILLSGLFAYGAHLAGTYGHGAQIAASAVLFVLCLACAEKLRLMPEVPAGWRPFQLSKFLRSALKSYLGAK
ncbi:MAG: hypothetical protein LBR87_08820 [Synergistaceae bacterium]|jgi:putative peptidoglycan lipid II flippase|nr:hypothetical protein [Synergistaceae bacterium]